MEINTRNFGLINIEEEEIISFPEGIPGFVDAKKYVLLGELTIDNPFQWLQSVDRPEIAFVVTDPFTILSDYIVDVEDSDVKTIEITNAEKVLTLAIVVIPDDITQISVNMRAPILINIGSKKGKQVLLNNEAYKIKHYLIGEKVSQIGGND